MMRAAFLLAALTMLLPIASGAQPVFSVDSARAAGVTTLRALQPAGTRVRFVPDSGTMWREYVVCESGTTPRGCSLRDGVIVKVVEVTLRPPRDADVQVRTFQTVRGRCARPDPAAPPHVAMIGADFFTMRLDNGRWAPFGDGGSAVC